MVRDISTNEGQMAESYYNYNPVDIDDLLLNPMDLYSGANCSLSKVKGVISPAYINLRYVKGTNPRFYDYFFKTQYWSMAFFAHGKGISFDNRWTLGVDTLFNYPIPVPKIEEQNTIATFLDEKCGEIDSIIALQEKIIEELKAFQYALISEVTTKGLNDNAEYIQSGVDWIGNMPSHWRLTTFKEYGIESEEKNKGNKTSELLALSYSLGVTLYKDKIYNKDRVKNDYEEYKIVHKGDIVLSPNDIIKGSIFVSAYDGCISPMYLIFHPRKPQTHNLRYLSYLLRNKSVGRKFFFMARGLIGEILDNGKYVTRRMTVAKNDITGFKVLLPPLFEQEQIVNYLDTKCAEIDALISLKQSKIETLKEYKKSIIYEYVTGKKQI